MTNKTLTAIAVVLVAIPTLGWAQSAARSGADMRMGPPQVDFAVADADASGGISQDEWTAYASAQMQERRTTRLGERADALIGAGDANADGQLTRDELIAGFTSLHEDRRAERDEDGRRGMRGHRDGDRRGMRGHRGGHGGRMDPAERAIRAFQHIDQNEDGQLSVEELAEMEDRMERRMQRRAGRDNG